jgi:sugar/nucleoside kinase (ribokinase family)
VLTVVGDTALEISVGGLERASGERKGRPPDEPPAVWSAESVVPALGGKGGSAAYVAASLGELVRLWSAVGADAFGELALRWLEGRNVDTASVRIMSDVGTSTSIIMADEQSRRQTIRYPGASGVFAPRVRAVSGGVGDWLLVTGYTLLSGWRGEAALELLRNARKSGIGTALDFGPVLGQALPAQELAALLPHTGILLCEATELELTRDTGLAEAASWALGLGTGAVVARQASRGAWVYEIGGGSFEVPGFDVTAEGSAAAESFNAGFLYAHSHGESLEASARFGAATAAIIARAARGVLDAPNERAVRDFLAPHNT